MRRFLLVGACASVTALSGCMSSHELHSPWFFAASRAVYGSQFDSGGCFATPGNACPEIVIVFLALPLAIDIVAMPVTIPHDLLFAR